MCWCQPNVKTPWCLSGPCDPLEIGRFQAIAKKVRPELAGNTDKLRRLTRAFTWNKSQFKILKRLERSARILGKDPAVAVERHLEGFVRQREEWAAP